MRSGTAMFIVSLPIAGPAHHRIRRKLAPDRCDPAQ